MIECMKTQYKSPELVAKSKSYKDLGFGNNLNNAELSSSLTKEGDHDISVLSAVVSKYFSGDYYSDNDIDEDDEEDDDDAGDSSIYAIPLKGRMRSNSMPELPSASSRYRRKY